MSPQKATQKYNKGAEKLQKQFFKDFGSWLQELFPFTESFAFYGDTFVDKEAERD